MVTGYMGECGLRGAYAEVLNMDPEVKAMMRKLISATLCPTVHGQVSVTYLMEYEDVKLNRI